VTNLRKRSLFYFLGGRDGKDSNSNDLPHSF
jgi:hypothetical protein